MTTTLSKQLWLMRSTASPEKTPWVTNAMTWDAPLRLRSLAARVIVLEVSARSSMSMAHLLATDPTRRRVAF